MLYKKMFLWLSLFCLHIYAHEFTLTDLETIAHAYPGNILPDNTDYYNPDFSTYFASLRTDFFYPRIAIFGY